MKRKTIFILITLTFLLLVGCGEGSLPVETIASIQTATQPKPTGTPTPTNTATKIPTTTPATPLFPVFTPDWSFLNNPTPIATPSSNSNSFQLADWNEEKAVGLVHLMEGYAYARDIAGMSGNRFVFQTDQKLTEFGVLEALARFPDSKYTQDLLWKLANIDTMFDEDTSDEWIINTLEDGLNNGDYSPADLDIVLSQHGFEIDEEYIIPNLFGDGEEGTVYLINTQHRYTFDGMLVTLREIKPGVYELILMVSHWNFHYGMWKIDRHFDLNGNGVPEIFAVSNNIASGSYSCVLYILEWREDHFVTLTEDSSPIHLSFCDIDYDKPKQTLIGGQKTLSYSEWFLEKFTWNGQVYELTEKIYSVITRSIYDKFWDQEFWQAIEEIEKYLAGDSYIKSFSYHLQVDEGVAIDFLRFVRGLAYAFQSDEDQAMEIFLDLAQSPTNSDYPYISQAAQAFVTNYSKDADVLKLCYDSLEVFQEVPGYYDEEGKPNNEAIGLSRYGWEDDLNNYCHAYAPPQLKN